MPADRSIEFTGLRLENPFLLSSAPPTESESNILRAFEAGWGGVVTKTIGLHPVVNVVGAKAKFMRTSPDDAYVSMKKRPGAALHSSWNWELISDKTARLVAAPPPPHQGGVPDRVLIASIMAGSGNDKELQQLAALARGCQDAGADGLELNFSCPHMDRKDMGSNIGKDEGLCSVVTEAVKEVATVPVWCKLTPATRDIVVEAGGCFRGGADAIVSSNTFPSLPMIDPETLEFEINVDGLVSSGGLGGPAILPMSLANMAQMTQAFPDRSFSGHRRHVRLRPGALLFPAGLRHGAGVHRRDARPGRRAQRHQAAARRPGRVPRAACGGGLDQGRELPRPPARSGRAAVGDPAARTRRSYHAGASEAVARA